MKALAIVTNIFIPGVGTLIVGKVGQGVAQILLYGLGIVLSFTVIGAIVGIPLVIGIWIWGIVVAANSDSKPVQVEVINRAVGR
jgi:TM2 domain-containing membrane protein YozV